MIYLGLFPGGVGFATWAVAQGAFGAGRAANFLYLVPPVAVAMTVVVNDEWPTWTTLTGGAIAIGGVVIVNARRRKSTG